jgi:DNA polymerase-3 subunit beta
MDHIFLELGENVTLTGTNAHVLTTRTIDKVTGNKTTILIPYRTANLLKGLNITENVQIEYGPRSVLFKTDNLTVRSTLVDNQFPNYKEIISITTEVSAMVDKYELLSALKRISLLSNRVLPLVILTVENDKIIIKTEDTDFGHHGTEEVSADCKGEMTLGANVLQMITAVSNYPTDQLFISFDTPSRPFVIRSDENNTKENLTLVMPLQYDSLS